MFGSNVRIVVRVLSPKVFLQLPPVPGNGDSPDTRLMCLDRRKLLHLHLVLVELHD